LRILQLIYESFGSPFGFGGAGVRAYEIYKRLKERHEITLLCMKYPKVMDGEIEGLRHVFVGTESNSLPKSVLSYTFKAAKYVRRYGKDYDVIVENFLPATPFFSKYLTKTQVVLQIQGIWGLYHIRKFNPFYGFLMYLMEKVYLTFYNKFILVTDINMGRLIKKSQKCSVIPNGIDKAFFHISNEEDNYILFLSRIDTYQKGLDVLISAFSLIAEKYKEIRLVLAGYEFNSVSNLIKRLPVDLKDRVIYAGFVTGDEKASLLSRAKVFVLPSRFEAHPVSVIEALACGRPVVVSNIPELRYVENNGIGLTFKSGSSRDLAEKLRTLLENGELRQNFGDKGCRYASNFLWDDMALRFERFLFKVVGKEG
jgi:glycosyltransferase involved in cell wall biosynthesis